MWVWLVINDWMMCKSDVHRAFGSYLWGHLEYT
jgi:hypothetical protein